MDKIAVQRIIDLLKEIKGINTFYDLHVHPFEVMYAPLRYHASPETKGLFSAGTSEYLSPVINDLDLRKRTVRAENITHKGCWRNLPF